VDPAPVGPLPLGQGLGHLLAPVVMLALGVHHLVNAHHVERLGHGVVVVVQAPLGTDVGHAGVLLQGVVLLDPLPGLLDALVVLGRAAVDHALDAGVGHAAVTGQAAVGVGVVLRLGGAAAGRTVDEAAVVDLAGPGLVVAFALEVLATADEDHGLLK